MRKLRNRFDVQAVFSDFAFSLKNNPNLEPTPEQVADELEQFCARIRNGGKATPQTAIGPKASR